MRRVLRVPRNLTLGLYDYPRLCLLCNHHLQATFQLRLCTLCWQTSIPAIHQLLAECHQSAYQAGIW